MKKVLLILTLAIGLLSCKKEEESNSSNLNGNNCNCGIIASDGIDGDCYWLEIRNNCSGNKKTFCFDYDVWFDGNPGENFCVTNVSSW
jgi:hypothetical protein